MIGSPASRGAVASVGGAGRACLAAASTVSAVSAAIAASVTMVGGPQRRIATVDCAVVNRFTMLSPVEMPLRACADQVSDRDFGITNGRHYPRQFAPWVIGTFRRQISHIRQPAYEEGWLACVCSPFMVIVAHRANVCRPAACRCTQATLPGKAHDLPVCAIARPLPCPNNQRRPHAWLCHPIPMQSLEAGMMNPRRLSTVPAPLLGWVILASRGGGFLG